GLSLTIEGDSHLTSPTSANYTATATDSRLAAGSAIAVVWTQVSGPTVIFATPQQPVTSVTFPVAGSYVLQATATDLYGSSFNQIAITVNTPASQGWIGSPL